MPFTAADHQFMSRALQLAEQGLYTTDPNPRVGCVLVREGKIIGEGFHQRAGEGHAEVNALKAAGDAKGATAYVTLEPCSHQGKTPPCAQALINAGVSQVISAMEDPNPLVAGKGHQLLENAGIRCQSGLLQAQSEQLNPGFIHRMKTGLPYVRIKQAMSLDGRTGMASGESKWITGAEARQDVQRLRARSSAIITGIGTVLADNPAMTVRSLQPAQQASIERQPIRVIADNHLKTPMDAAILNQPGETIIFHQCSHTEAIERLVTAGATLVHCDGLNPKAMLRWLVTERQVNEVLVEAGATLAGSFTQAGLVNEWRIYIAPTLLGSQARPLFTLNGIDLMDQQIRLTQTDMRMVGQDIRLTFQPATDIAMTHQVATGRQH